MKKLLFVAAVVVIASASVSTSARAQCAACVWSDGGGMGNGYAECIFGPLLHPQGIHCVVVNEFECDIEEGPPCTPGFGGNDLLTPAGTAVAAQKGLELQSNGMGAYRACRGLLISFAYTAMSERDARLQTDHLVV